MMLEPTAMRSNAVVGFTSVRGRSHTFDSRADGYARGEAIDAISCRLCTENRRSVHVLGSAVRHDGRSASLTAPNGQAQQGLLCDGVRRAQRFPDLEESCLLRMRRQLRRVRPRGGSSSISRSDPGGGARVPRAAVLSPQRRARVPRRSIALLICSTVKSRGSRR